MFETSESSFDGLDTEYLWIRHFEKNTLIKPVLYYVVEKILENHIKDVVVLENQKVYGQFIPTYGVFHYFFELPAVLQQCLDYVYYKQLLQQEPLCSIFQCCLRKSVSSKYTGKHFLPIYICILTILILTYLLQVWCNIL